MWTKQEEDALREAIQKHGTNYKLIKTLYGPPPEGNNLLTARITGNRIMSKARTVAQKNPNDPVFKCVIKHTQPTQQTPTEKPTFPAWTNEQDQALLEGFQTFGSKWKSISNNNPLLTPQYQGSRFRDRVALLQARELKRGHHVDTLVPGKEKTLSQHLVSKDHQYFIECPGCERRVTAQDIAQRGLVCVCGAPPAGLLGALNKYSQETILAILGQASGSSSKEEPKEAVDEAREEPKEAVDEAKEEPKVPREVIKDTYWEEDSDDNPVKGHFTRNPTSTDIVDRAIRPNQKNQKSQKKSLKEESKVTYPQEQEDLYILCPACDKRITSNKLMTSGLQCECGINTQALSKALAKFNSIVYIVSAKGKPLTTSTEFVSCTANLFKRLYDYKEWANPEMYTIRVSLRLSEKMCISLFKPTKVPPRPQPKNGSITFRIKDTLTVWDGEPPTTQTPTLDQTTEPFPKFHTSAGLISSKKTYKDIEYCYLAGHAYCECNPPCALRELYNITHNLPKHHPISDELIVKKNAPEVDYGIGLPCEKSERFLTALVTRNKNVTESTKKCYSEYMKVLCDRGFIEKLNTPELLIDELYEAHALKTVSLYLTAINNLFSLSTLSEKVTIFGDKWEDTKRIFQETSKDIRLQLEELKLSQNKTEREQENWMELPELVEAYKDYFSKKPAPGSTEYIPYLMLSLHLFQASIRNDYRKVKLFEYDTSSDNYLDWESKKFVFNDFKNVKSLGRITHDISPQAIQLVTEARDHAKAQGYNYLITTSGEEMTSRAYTSRLTGLTDRMTSNTIGSRMLRKITVSHIRRNELTTIENKELSNLMMHSESMSRTVYRKL